MVAENVIIQGNNYLKAAGTRNEPGFMVRMVREAKPPSLMDFDVFDGSDGDYVLYKTGTLIKLSDYLSLEGMDKNSFRRILENVNDAVRQCSEILIPPERLILEPGFIYIRAGTLEIKFIISLFDEHELRKSMKNFFTGILGNYYSGYGIDDERFREWAAREISRGDFTAARMLSSWEYKGESAGHIARDKPQADEKIKKATLLKNFLGKALEERSNRNSETRTLGTKQDGLHLTGICSIDTKIPVAEEGVTIGRQMLSQDYGLYNNGIGKTHARIYMMEGEVYVSDMGSRNGTYVNGERIKKQVPEKIAKGDIISFSDEEFILC